MVEVINDEKLLIYHFLDSLARPALNWYMSLNGSKKEKLEYLADVFLQ
jgi:hypothetical protein